MTLNDIKILLAGTIKQAFTNKKVLDKFSESEEGKLLYNASEIATDIKISEEEGNAIQKQEDGSLFVSDKTEQIERIETELSPKVKYHKYSNTELDYGVFEITNMTITKDTPLVFSSVVSGNMKLSENGFIKLQKDKTYAFHVNLYGVLYATGIFLVDSSLNVLSEGVTSSIGNYIYHASEDIEVTFLQEDTNVTSAVHASWSCVNVHEIGREIIIDPVEHVNDSQGIEDTPVGHIIAHMGITAPKHYLACDGSEYNITDYPYLAQHIEESFGSVNHFGGDGTTTFAVPDLRGEFLRGTGTATRDTGSGAEVGEHQDPTQHINFTSPNSANDMFYPYTDNVYPLIKDKDIEDSNSSYYFTQKVTRTSGWNMVSKYTSRPTNTSVLYCIKYEPTYFMIRNNTNYLQPNLYSSEERVIGCWIDGKPIYQKTLETINVPNKYQVVTYTHNLNIDTYVNIYGGECGINGDKRYAQFPFTQTSSSGTTQTFGFAGMAENAINFMSSWNGNNIKNLTIQYTKLSDAENSFTTDMIKDYVQSGNSSCDCETYTDEEINNEITNILKGE